MRRAVAIVAAVLLMEPAYAWNNTGHKVIAAIAYSRLNTKARKQVRAILQSHPDFALLIQDAESKAAQNRSAFLKAATWPDIIRNDRRFVSTPSMDANCMPGQPVGAAPSPVLPGFPDMQVHQDWHFINGPFSPDGTPVRRACEPNALTAIEHLRSILSDPATTVEQKAFALPWLMHVIGDVHQPLHAVSRFTHDFPGGDRGGNQVQIGETNLHSYWDQLLGRSDDDKSVLLLAKKIKDGTRRAAKGTPETWIEESFILAKDGLVYRYQGAGTKAAPAVASPAYRNMAVAIARVRVAEAGYRLADVLNQAFK